MTARLLLGGDGSRVLLLGDVKVGRIRERGIGRFAAALEDGTDVGTYRTRQGAIDALLAQAVTA